VETRIMPSQDPSRTGGSQGSRVGHTCGFPQFAYPPDASRGGEPWSGRAGRPESELLTRTPRVAGGPCLMSDRHPLRTGVPGSRSDTTTSPPDRVSGGSAASDRAIGLNFVDRIRIEAVRSAWSPRRADRSNRCTRVPSRSLDFFVIERSEISARVLAIRRKVGSLLFFSASEASRRAGC
jgi:hypothetical protein